MKSRKQAISFFVQVSIAVMALSHVLVLGRISADTPGNLTEVSRDFPLSLQANAGIVSRLGNEDFLFNSSSIHCSTIGRYVHSVVKLGAEGGGGRRGGRWDEEQEEEGGVI
jgi:hypothetical protein